MKVEYVFEFADGKRMQYQIDVLRSREPEDGKRTSKEEWTFLKHCKCTNCPLNPSQVYCPVALDIESIVKDFKSQPAFQKVNVTVTTHERGYFKRTSLEEGLRSMLGLIMATSRCPILAELKPMAMQHMPFSSGDEFILRSASTYLLQQYFTMRAGKTPPDWDLKGLVDRNKRLQLVNQALWQRIHTVCESDSNLKALLSFFSMASSVSFSLESQLQKIKAHLE